MRTRIISAPELCVDESAIITLGDGADAVALTAFYQPLPVEGSSLFSTQVSQSLALLKALVAESDPVCLSQALSHAAAIADQMLCS